MGECNPTRPRTADEKYEARLDALDTELSSLRTELAALAAACEGLQVACDAAERRMGGAA